MKTASISQFLELFNQFSRTEQLKIADKIDKQTFEERWQIIDAKLPDAELSEEDKMKEVRAVRYDRETLRAKIFKVSPTGGDLEGATPTPHKTQ